MKEVHFVVQAKGGVGKSFTAALLAQYLRDRSRDALHCFDIDPRTPIFSNYASLHPTVVELEDKKRPGSINTVHFDGLMDNLIDKQGIAVADTGTSTFEPLMSYIAENGADEELAAEGVRVVMHIPLVGGQAKNECLNGLVRVLDAVDAQAVIWLNERWGEVHENGVPFEQFKLYENRKKQIAGIVRIPALNPDTYGKDIADMTERNLTFGELAGAGFGRWSLKRLLEYRDLIWTQLDAVPFEAVPAQTKSHTENSGAAHEAA